MRAADTNVVVRLVTRDNPTPVSAAEEFVAKGAWISHLVLAETTWVLEAVYELKASELATAIEMLLNHAQFTIQDSEVVSAALEKFRQTPAVSFSDCLLLEIARKAGHTPLGTFDRDLAKLDGVQRL